MLAGSKNCGLSPKIIIEISNFAKLHGVEKVVLFGSRARGDNRLTSDIDLAVYGGNVAEFKMDVDEKVSTLLEVDVVDISDGVSEQLRYNIERDGVIIYAKS